MRLLTRVCVEVFSSRYRLFLDLLVGIVLLVVECIGATTVIFYGINLLFNPVHEPFVDDPKQPGCPQVSWPLYAGRVLTAFRSMPFLSVMLYE